MDLSTRCCIELPDWTAPWLASRDDVLTSETACMALVLELGRQNIARRSGGPFAAAIIDPDTASLVSVGVNLVTSGGLSMAHAEVVAISLAQHRLGHWDLSEFGRLALYTSCEPCAMCFGAVPWSGVRTLVCGASKADAEAAGFDEGEKPGNWKEALQARGIDVVNGVMREQAVDLFTQYRNMGGQVYNAGSEPIL